ncbi:MAG: hypothetical protein EKK53_14130 [Burkholderiales bacterium]|nr:MAG: hypothetical protein EKK53_14130 [Burkholderiales bacterium]
MSSAGLALVSIPVAAAPNAVTPAVTQASASFWREVSERLTPLSARNAKAVIQPTKFRAAALDKAGITAFAATAPLERSAGAALAPLVIALPHPEGGFQRFALVESPIMEEGLAAQYPQIKTYAGKGLDDPGATLRMDISPLGLRASVRSASGAWYVEPYYHLDDSVYASYYGRHLPNPRTPLVEAADGIAAQLSLSRSFYHAADAVEVRGAGFAPGATVALTIQAEGSTGTGQTLQVQANAEGVISATFPADPGRGEGAYTVAAQAGEAMATTAYHVVSDAASPAAAVASQLRVYRLALLTDPSYASYFGGDPTNVLAAKVALINRVTQIYEDETSIRLVLINDTPKLNLDTAAKMTGTNGPCGGAACFTTTQAGSCGGGTLTRNRQVLGLLVGASAFDIGHIGLGLDGGGIASLGVVGGSGKAQGCTGIPTPVGDFYAVDYVAHEMGHQFSGNHTFNGTIANCSTSNRNDATSVEPGSGSSIMAYAGICGTDDLQSHSDPYWSQRSFDEIVAYTSSAESNIAEVQLGVLTGFTTNGLQFQFKYNGNLSAAITRGTNFNAAGLKSAIEGLPGWPAAATVTASSISDNAFTLTFATAAGNVPNLELVPVSAGVTGFIGEVAKGGLTTRGGSQLIATGNNAPVVTAPASYTIPVRTPFALTGSAIDPDGDTVTYLWEQNDRGATGTAGGTGLITQPKTNGPLFRQFGVASNVSSTNTLLYGSPGENVVTTNPTRVFPDMAQILANNTNAETGSCPLANATAPTASEIDCFSEFLPTSAYTGTPNVNANPASLNFRLTARDGRGGVSSANTQLILAPNAGPFLVTSPNTAITLDSGKQTVTWSVANTNVAPVSTANVKITLSTDGGLSFPTVLAASTPNTGSAVVTLPAVVTTKARIKVEAVDNIFFDVSNADFSIKIAGDLNGDGAVTCADVAIVRSSFGKRTGQPAFDARADIDKNGVVDVRDLAYVTQRLPAGTTCN